MRKILILTSVALLLTSWGATAAIPPTAAQAKVEEISSLKPFSRAVLGVFAVNAAGDTLVCYNHEVKMVPASNVKLISTGLALRRLGEDFRFETRLSHSGEIIDGTLEGDLYIIGGGDPTTGSKAQCALPVDYQFSQWAKLIREAGIKRIEGRVIADPRFFDSPVAENLGWSYDDLGTFYGVGPAGLNFFENQQNFYVTPGSAQGLKANIEPRFPETPWMRYVNSSKTGEPRSANTLSYINTPLSPAGQFVGEFPIDRKAYTFEASNKFGALTCAYYFYNYLNNNGISVSGGYADLDPDGFVRSKIGIAASQEAPVSAEELKSLGSCWSSSLSEIVRETNAESNNFFAETLLKILAVKERGSCREDFNVEVAEELMKRYGLDISGRCQVFDGSGLSRKNYVSPEFFVDFLSMMWHSDTRDAYLRSLPQPGGKGTLEYKFLNAPDEFKNRIKMKSGSMNGVRCYSGYILSSDADESKTIFFSLLTNNVTESSWAVNPSIDRIIEAIAAEN